MLLWLPATAGAEAAGAAAPAASVAAESDTPVASTPPAASGATTAAWQTVPLTANHTTNEQSRISGDLVVWRAFDGVDWEILLYDLAAGTTRQLTHDGIAESDPRVDGQHVVWTADDGTGPSLVFYNLADDSSKRLPHSENVRGPADINGGLVTWRAGDGNASAIYLFDLASGTTTRLTSAALEYSSPRTDGRFVVFDGAPALDPDLPSPGYHPASRVFLYDSTTKQLVRLGGDGASGGRIAQGLAVWQEGGDKQSEIYLYDTAAHATTRLTTNQAQDIAPAVGGSRVTWLQWGRADDMMMPHDSPWKVMLYDAATKATRVVSDSSLAVAMQDDGKVLVWSYWGRGPAYVAYDVGTGASSELGPTGLQASYDVDLDGGRIVWRSYPAFRLDDDSTIYLATRATPPPAATPPTPPVRTFGDIASSPYAKAIVQLAERGIVRGYRAATPAGSAEPYALMYRPDAPTLRWQFLKMLLAVAGIEPTAYTNQPPFKDVQALEGSSDFTLRYYVEAGLEKGLMTGVTPTTFAPFRPITRAQAVTAVMRAAKATKPAAFDWLIIPDKMKRPTFGGSLGDFSPIHADNMRIAEWNKLLVGLVGFGPSWNPWAPLSRGEAAQLLAALAGKS